MTAADVSHELSLLQLLESIARFESQAEVVVWDLGLSDDIRRVLSEREPATTVRSFPFELYPEHLNIKVAAGEYAWKPVIVAAEAETTDQLVLWLDAGDLLTGPLEWLRRLTNATGFYSPYSSGCVADWTHPATAKRLGAEGRLMAKRNLNGAVIAFDPGNEKAMALLRDWVECALSRDCIAPLGSSRANHRQDQAVLTVLAYRHQLVKGGALNHLVDYIHLRTHQDVELAE